MAKQSHGTIHHADTTVVCPDCGRKFIHPHHAGVAEDWGEFISVQFKSKQTGRWGVLRVPVELVSGAMRAMRRGRPRRRSGRDSVAKRWRTWHHESPRYGGPKGHLDERADKRTQLRSRR